MEYDPEAFRLGTLHSGEIVIGDLDNDPDIHLPDNDFAKRAKYRNTDLAAEALGQIDAEGEGYNGEYVVRSYTFRTEIGVNDCVKTQARDEIIRAFRPTKKKRNERTYPTRYVIARVGEPTRTVTFMLQRRLHIDSNTMSVVAAYMGEKAEPEPVGRYQNSKKSKKYWRKHALVLQSPKQIDQHRLITRGDQGREMSYGELEDLFEATEREFVIKKTVEHMREGEFGPRYVQMARQHEARALVQLDKKADREAGEFAEQGVETFASWCLIKFLSNNQPSFKYWQFVTPAGAKAIKLAGWGKLIHSARQIPTPREGEGKALKKSLTKTYSQQIKTSDEYNESLAQTEADIRRSEAEATDEINRLIRELQSRKNDPAYIEAASLWTNAPDSDSNIGRSGRGFSGGLVHFFEYRSDIEKRKRFAIIDEPMTVDGFIAFTNRLKVQLDTAKELRENADIPTDNEVVVLNDAQGRRRYYIRQPSGELIIAYQLKDQEPKLSTLITDCTMRYLLKIIRETKEERDRKIRINKLGPKIKIEFSNIFEINNNNQKPPH